MFFLLFLLLHSDISECWRHDNLLSLAEAGAEEEGGEMTPVNNTRQGSDYALGRVRATSNPLDCLVKKKTTVKRKGLAYLMRCSSSHSFDKCEFRTPAGDLFQVTEDMEEDEGRIICLCKVVRGPGQNSQIHQNCFQEKRFRTKIDLVKQCGIRIRELQAKDRGQWQYVISHFYFLLRNFSYYLL